MLRNPAEVHKAAVGVREAGASGTNKSGVCSLRRDVLSRLLNIAGAESWTISIIELTPSASEHAVTFDGDHRHLTCAVSLCAHTGCGMSCAPSRRRQRRRARR